MDLRNIESLRFFGPELILTGTILLLILLDLFVKNKRGLALVAMTGCVASLVSTLDLYGAPQGWLFYRMIVLDNFSLFFKVVSLVAVLVVIWMSLDSYEIRQVYQGEYYTLLLTSALGMFFMASSTNLLMAYLSLELVSITSYIVTGLLPRNRRSSEAALKYLIYGGVASGTMIYGMSWVFGMTGSLDYAVIQQALGKGEVNAVALFMAIIFILAGFGYKIAFVPFHMWSPDAYQGAPTPFTAFLSVASNAAGLAILIRFFYQSLSQMMPDGTWVLVTAVEWPQVLFFASIITMTVGNLSALNQRNLKRMLAYSGIAHAGYMLMGLVVMTHDGLSAILFYIVVYLIMNIGAFIVVGAVGNFIGSEDIDAYRGLAWRGAVVPAVCFAIFLFSLTGLPPFAGFIGKFLLFAAVLKEGGIYIVLALVAIANSVVSLYFYARVVKVMFLDNPDAGDKSAAGCKNGALLIPLAVLTVFFGIYFGPLVQYAELSLSFFMP